nr:DUF6236 family protein [Glycomyces amatae]
MARIAPRGYTDQGNHEARTLRDELDFILDLGPGESALQRVGTKALEALGMHGDRIRDRYRIPERVVRTIGGASSAGEERIEYRFPDLGDAVRIEDPTRRWPQPVDAPAPESFHRLIGLHSTKVHHMLRRSLVDNRLAALDDSGAYAAVHPNFAWAYMCMLADEMAHDDGLTPVSDDASAYTACGAWTPTRFAAALLGEDLHDPRQDGDPQAQLAMLALNVAIPRDPEGIPIERIIAVRKRYGAELDAFRTLITATGQELAAELESVRRPALIEAYLKETVAQRIERPLGELRRAMRGLGVETALGAASIKFEVPAAATLAAGWAAGQPVVAGAGAAVGIATWYRNWRVNRAEHLRNAPVSYLWRVERGLSGPDLLRRLLGPR